MSLLSAKIPAKRRLAFSPTPNSQEKAPPSSIEDLRYSRLLALDPVLEALVEAFDLVDSKTGKSPERGDLAPYYKTAKRLLSPEESYTEEEIKHRIREEYKATPSRAEEVFKKLLASGAILPTLNPDLYYLGGSTPF